MEKVEGTQYQVTFAITGTWKDSDRSKLYEELGWETVSDRRWRILQIHKIKTTRLLPTSQINYLQTSRLLYRCNNSNNFHEIYP